MTFRWPVLALLLLAGACKSTEPVAPEAAPAGAASMAVRWLHPRLPAAELAVFEVPAHVVAGPLGRAAVSAPVRVQVARVLVRAGDRVEVGTPLAEVLAPDLVQAAAVRQSAGVRMAAHQKYLGGLRGLRSEGLMRTADVFQVEVQLADLQAARAEAEARLRGAGVTDAEVQILSATGRWTLRAPVAGVVRELAMEPGAVIEPGAAVLARIEGVQPVRVEVRLHHGIPAGAGLALALPGAADLPLQPTPVSSAVDPLDGSTIAWFDAAGTGPNQPTLAAGTRGRLRVTGLPADVLQVPARALLQDNGRARVVRRRGTDVRTVPVEVIAVAGAVALVRGLQPSDEIAAEADRALGATPELGDSANETAGEPK